MKKMKSFLMLGALALTFGFVACSDDETNNTTGGDINNGPINDREAEYLVASSEVLRNDCLTLWASWEGGTGESALMEEIELEIGTPYGEEYKNAGKAGSRYQTQLFAVNEIVEGIVGIADELGKVKMGAANGGEGAAVPTEAESRFSKNSYTDFKNNLLSIENSYLGGYDANDRGKGLSDYIKEKDAALDTEVKAKIDAAIAAIDDCATEGAFVDNLKSSKVETAMTKIAEVEGIFADEVATVVANAGDYDFTEILADYVDKTIIPTYAAMFTNSKNLLAKAETFKADMTKANLEAAANAWKGTRAPWEKSESFLFGPAGDHNLDPLLDSWPVDETQLSNVLNSAQSLNADFVANGLGYTTRGFHTVEYLIFREGNVRGVE